MSGDKEGFSAGAAATADYFWGKGDGDDIPSVALFQAMISEQIADWEGDRYGTRPSTAEEIKLAREALKSPVQAVAYALMQIDRLKESAREGEKTYDEIELPVGRYKAFVHAVVDTEF